MDAIKNYKFDLRGYDADLKCFAHDIEVLYNDIEQYPTYRDNFYTFILVESGSAVIKVNGFVQTVEPRTIICSLPGELWEWPEGCSIKGKFLCFEPEFLMSVIKDSQLMQRYSFLRREIHNPFIRLTEKGFLWVRDIIIEIMEEIVPSAKQFDLIKAQLWHLILLIEKEYEYNKREGEKLPVKNLTSAFIELVGSKLYREHKVAYYADKLCITPNYLNKIINKSLGISASAYIRKRILSEAKALLTITELNINEIAQALGFESANYFIRFFRKHQGITPGEFRKNAAL